MRVEGLGFRVEGLEQPTESLSRETAVLLHVLAVCEFQGLRQGSKSQEPPLKTLTLNLSYMYNSNVGELMGKVVKRRPSGNPPPPPCPVTMLPSTPKVAVLLLLDWAVLLAKVVLGFRA